jgi:hypothetical protein
VTISILRFTFAAPDDDSKSRHQRLRGALELAKWGEEHGVTGVSVDEHHATGHGWSSNPILAASWFLAQTNRSSPPPTVPWHRCGIRSGWPKTSPRSTR